MIPKVINLSGRTYIKYVDDLHDAKIGDLQLYMNDDTITDRAGDYHNIKFSGYFKIKVFDGMTWQHCNISEFCLNNEHKFAKRQRPLDTAMLCREILVTQQDTKIYRTYRGHFTVTPYVADLNVRKHPKWLKK